MTREHAKESLEGTFLKSPTYPSNCLAFLNEKLIESSNNTCRVPLNIVVVGAGLGGLATAIALASSGHSVTVYEQAPALGEVGAGIQIPSNSTRLLSRLGLDPYLEKYVTEPEVISFRRWESGDIIGLTCLMPDFRNIFHAPYYVIHRADFHTALHQRALDLGVSIKLASRVTEYNPQGSSIFSREWDYCFSRFDRVKSVARRLVDKPGQRAFEQTGFAAYRATVDVAKMKADPEISWLLERPSLNIWIGDQRHVMTYTIGAGKSFNMVLSHPDTTDPVSWDRSDALSDMKREFQGWDKRLEKIIGMIESTIKWPLVSGIPLTRWASGRIVILGDAAHTMLPYMSQGKCCNGCRRWRGIGMSLSKIESKADIPQALGIFEQVRIDRTSKMQEASLLNGKLWHFSDGPLQRARDAAMQPETRGEPFSHSPNQWSDPATQMWTYQYDAEAEIEIAWQRSGM
ncbi:hypothetical protein N7509_003110 [Penicillium cosmopolitanum]|uniref:FAD-binding domain-containing protein n=1 Tax=Penicillium cosmopolitanum TaxID=1131564 RepID=A0A9W9W4A1_9EURO|nr:uncharacterized protein N7509_003110 [Penicillium cosmopolitanum]KAJ5403239.1 hypothetical protein N7509_003110 [Penicillium cosmopolitanum]